MSCDTTQSRGWFISTNSNSTRTVTLSWLTSRQQNMISVSPVGHTVYKKCQRGYNACVHPPHPIAAHYTRENTHRLNAQHVEALAVESLTFGLTNRSLCSHQLTTPLSTDTGLFEPPCPTYQRAVDTTHAGSHSADCNLYQPLRSQWIKLEQVRVS